MLISMVDDDEASGVIMSVVKEGIAVAQCKVLRNV